MTETERKLAVLRLSARLLDEALEKLQWSDVAATQEDGEAILTMSREGPAGMRLLADAIEQDSKKATEAGG